ncbi:MAG: LTA synthase family protein [Flavobacteriales bacterium]|nr:LTA synthase family protein [Flavobacteriales bacterium]
MNSYLNHLKLLLKKLGIAFLIFSLCRILFYIFNVHHFTDVSFDLFLYGLQFDLVAISFLFAPLVLLHLIPFPFRSFKKYSLILSLFFYLPNSLAILLNLLDVAYFDFTIKRTTADFFGMIGTGDDFFKLLPHYIIDFWYDYILLIGLLILSWFLHKKYCNPVTLFKSYVKKDYIIHSSIFILFSGLMILGMRGGVQYKPINIVNAGQHAQAQNIPVVLNTPFTIMKTLFVGNIESVSYFSENELSTIYTPEKSINTGGALKGKNVVLIILESMTKEYVGGFNNGKGYTPFIDSLLKESYVFTNAYANGQRSIEALPCLLTGLPQLMNSPYVLSTYTGNKLNGFPEILKEHGYNTSFYHGGANGTMNFNGFVGVVGIDNYYGLNEYPTKEKDFDGLWGIFDEPYLQYYADELNKKQEPFFSTIFTVSSHHPYTIPKQHIGKFPKGDLPLHETVGYTDYALKEFFKTAQKMSWFNNTVFVFTADHSSKSSTAIYNTRLGRYSVPVFFYAPTTYLKGVNDELFQHIDIPSTIIGLLGIKSQFISFGNHAFDESTKFAVQYVSDRYQTTVKNNFLIFDGEKTTDFYNLKQDSLLTKNLINCLSLEQNNEKNKAEKLLKGIIQQYNNRLINNNLSISK